MHKGFSPFMIFFISYLYWSWGRGRARFSFEMWAVREHLHMITGSSRCAVHSLSLRFLLCERYWRILLLCLLLESDYLISTICYSVCWMCNSRVSDISFQTGWSFCSREHCQVWKENRGQRWSCNNNSWRWPNQVYSILLYHISILLSWVLTI